MKSILSVAIYCVLIIGSTATFANPLAYPIFACSQELDIANTLLPGPLPERDDAIFEGGAVRPLAAMPALPSGQSSYPGDLDLLADLLFVVSAPTNCLHVFTKVDAAGVISLKRISSVHVGVEPVSVNTRIASKDVLVEVVQPDNSVVLETQTKYFVEAWVVNHISDSVSVVEISPDTVPIVAETILVGDEPRDIVFAGTNSDRAFVSAAARGHRRFYNTHALREGWVTDPGSTSVGEDNRLGQGDVWVFDADTRAFEGIINLLSAPIRALAVTADNLQVYAAAFMSGNRTSIVPSGAFVEEIQNQDGGTVRQLTAKQAPSPQDMFTAYELSFFDSSGGIDPNPDLNLCEFVPGSMTETICDTAPLVSLIVKDTSDPLATTPVWQDEVQIRHCEGVLTANCGSTPMSSNWNDEMSFDYRMPDKDIFVINANAVLESDWTQHTNRGSSVVVGSYSGVGTTIFNMAIGGTTSEHNGYLAVTTMDALNIKNFEPRLNGNFVENKVSVVDLQAESVLTYPPLPGEVLSPSPAPTFSSAMPTSIIYAAEINRWFYTAFGGDQIHYTADGVVWKSLNVDTIDSGGLIDDGASGPTGLVFKDNILYVYSRFDNSLRAYQYNASNDTLTALDQVAMYSPESDSIKAGRKLFYDAVTTGNGRVSCASCHIYGDMDELAWNLGNPMTVGDLDKVKFPGFDHAMRNEANHSIASFDQILMRRSEAIFHPMKGPMLTQTLRGLKGQGTMHWRGDKGNLYKSYLPFFWDATSPLFLGNVIADGIDFSLVADPASGISERNDLNMRHATTCGQPNPVAGLGPIITGPCETNWNDRDFLADAANWPQIDMTIEEQALSEFNPAFVSLLGGASELSAAQFNDFSDFVFALTFPPNPVKPVVDAADRPNPQEKSVIDLQFIAGENVYLNDVTTGGQFTCNFCHAIDGEGFGGGTTGTNTFMLNFPANPDNTRIEKIKIPHLRNVYQRVGLYDIPNSSMTYQPQYKGFGFAHDSKTVTLDRFLQFVDLAGNSAFDSLNAQGDAKRKSVMDFMLQFDTGMHPLEARQFTLQASDFSCPTNNNLPADENCDMSSYYGDGSISDDGDPTNDILPDKDPGPIIDLISDVQKRTAVKMLRLAVENIGSLPSDHPDKAVIPVWETEISDLWWAQSPETCRLVIQGTYDNKRSNLPRAAARDYIAISNSIGSFDFWMNASDSIYHIVTYSPSSASWAGFGFGNFNDTYPDHTDEWIGMPFKDILLTAMTSATTFTCYPTSI